MIFLIEQGDDYGASKRRKISTSIRTSILRRRKDNCGFVGLRVPTTCTLLKGDKLFGNLTVKTISILMLSSLKIRKRSTSSDIQGNSHPSRVEFSAPTSMEMWIQASFNPTLLRPRMMGGLNPALHWSNRWICQVGRQPSLWHLACNNR